MRILEYLKHNNELYRDRTIESAYTPEYWLRACVQSSRVEDILKKKIRRFGSPNGSYIRKWGQKNRWS